MAFKAGRNAVVFYNEVNLTSYLNSASLSGACETSDITVFGNTWKAAIAGLMGAECSFAGFHDVDQVEIDSSFAAVGGVLTFAPGGGSAVGDATRLVTVISSSLETSAEPTSAVAISWSVTADASVGFGQMLHPLAEDTNTTTGSSKDDAAATTTGWMAHLHVTAMDGGAWVVKLEDSANNSAWSDVSGGAFTSLSAAGSQRLTSASGATLRRYVRYTATRTGGSVGNGVTFALAYARSI